MHTYMPKGRELSRAWHVVDAKGQPLGRVAAEVAVLLRGKHKAVFAPHVDCGDHVVVINCSEAVFTGKKLENKRYIHHTGYIGHLKTECYGKLFAKKPEFVMKLAVTGMLPRNCQGRKQALRMHLFSGPEHNKQAQRPQLWKFSKEAV